MAVRVVKKTKTTPTVGQGDRMQAPSERLQLLEAQVAKLAAEAERVEKRAKFAGMIAMWDALNAPPYLCGGGIELGMEAKEVVAKELGVPLLAIEFLESNPIIENSHVEAWQGWPDRELFLELIEREG